MKTLIRTVAIAAAAALTLPALASAAYPPPANPGKPLPRPGGTATLKVCKKGCAYKTIQAAVKAARAGDTVRIADGIYKEQVTIEGASKQGIKLIGNAKNPSKVLINAAGNGNGVIINAANNVSLQGLSSHGYADNGFFAVNVDGYKMDKLIATGYGVYGVYAFNSKGGTITNSDAYYHTDAGFYIGQTPFQTKPKRTYVQNVRSWGNVLGWSGTNMRYVNITKSQFFNNGTGLVPNALVGELYPPEEDNVISDNDIYWNNFNYYKPTPFPKVTPTTGAIPYPVGVGVLLFGGRRNLISNNRVFGNWGVGIGMLEQIKMGADQGKVPASQPVGVEPWVLVDNRVTGNTTGNNGKDINGRDLFYDGSGTGNCFSDNTLTAGVDQPAFTTVAFPACNAAGQPGPTNTFNGDAQNEAINWALALSIFSAPGGMLPQPTSASFRGTKPFPRAPDGDYSVWSKTVQPPK